MKTSQEKKEKKFPKEAAFFIAKLTNALKSIKREKDEEKRRKKAKG